MSNTTLQISAVQYATEHLQRLRYTILHNTCEQQPISLVCTRENTLVFVLVKHHRRNHASAPDEPVRTRIRAAAVRWLAETHHARTGRDIRFDAIGVLTDPDGRLQRLDHLEQAF
jgi:Holliday junction resolvase-like predicted endonuclease